MSVFTIEADIDSFLDFDDQPVVKIDFLIGDSLCVGDIQVIPFQRLLDQWIDIYITPTGTFRDEDRELTLKMFTSMKDMCSRAIARVNSIPRFEEDGSR